ncbi:FecR domain-containing protein [Flammeovirgaceae bacterium SG7u.111]|nr:FecR domain-containing protein [Flammeovirgaceae bacterium SG7u.132]WPO38521.1 FecR domain-containing protein [Flammeovirgaceae bacterium SG7u.111]
MDKILIDKYFNNKCTPEEEEKVKAWLASMKADFEGLSSLEKTWYKFEPPKEPEVSWDKEELYKKIKSIINASDEAGNTPVRKLYPETKSISSNKRNNSVYTFRKKEGFNSYAAAITFFLIAGIAAYFAILEPPKKQLAQYKEEIQTKSNPKGIKSSITFPDGTVVKLNSDSKISFPKKFNAYKRVVTLEGEAFFEVTPDSTRPFIVKVGNVEAKVLGTSFNINTLADPNKVDIALLTGKLAVYSPNEQKEILLPTERAVYDKNSGQISTGHFDAEQVLSWKEGILIFKGASIDEITARLERWYNCEIVFADNANLKAYNKINFTGKFNHKTLKEVLEGMAIASGLQFELKNKKVFFY